MEKRNTVYFVRQMLEQKGYNLPDKAGKSDPIFEEQKSEKQKIAQALSTSSKSGSGAPGEPDEIGNLNRMVAAVLNYLSDDELEEVDIKYLLDDTEGLREWWDRYRESNRKQIEEEIKKSLGELSLKELVRIREQIKEKED